MKPLPLLTCLIFAVATAALAHSGVKNVIVKARMDAMSSISVELKTLGLMANGKTDFDLTAARAAASAITKHAAEIPDLFKAQEDDPKSEAKDAIWTNFNDFAEQAFDLEGVAFGLSTSLETSSDLPAALKSLGQTCRACHKDYRD
ncbi:MAG: cytochrome c556 [Planctomycetota bacterium]|jgi:cytochrome c556